LDDININSPSALNESSADLEALNIYPNPLANNSVVEFDLLKSGNVRVSVMDVLGRETNELFNGKMNVGLQKITLDKNLFPSNGIYFLRISSGESVITQKFLVK
jgi:hypothetical protein